MNFLIWQLTGLKILTGLVHTNVVLEWGMEFIAFGKLIMLPLLGLGYFTLALLQKLADVIKAKLARMRCMYMSLSNATFC